MMLMLAYARRDFSPCAGFIFAAGCCRREDVVAMPLMLRHAATRRC